MQPAGTGTSTTTTEIWQWQCAVCRADWKMLRQVTTTCCTHGHAWRCCHGTPPTSPRNPQLPAPRHHHHRHHHRRQERTSWALAAAERANTNNGRDISMQNSAPPLAVAQGCWVPDTGLMVQQLREFETLSDEVVALRVQLQEYAEEIDRSVRRDDAAGTNWFLSLPASVRDVLVMARDAIDSFIAISAAASVN